MCRVLGHPAEVNPDVEILDCDLTMTSILRSQIVNEALKFHFGIE